MKKKLVFLSALGVAGGLLYALESQHQRNKRMRQRHPSADDDRSVKDGEYDRDRQLTSRTQLQNAELRDNQGEHPLDDQGTDQAEASQILKHIRDHAFDASDENLALALGRPTQEIEEWTSGKGLIDGDVVMKARTLAMQRGFEI